MANRIITVGSLGRLERMLKHFDEDKEVKRFESSRGFTTVTGTFNGVPLSIVSIGMGTPNMDFFVRETRLVIDGPAAMVRYVLCV
jgi:uridine phosphorylase